VWLEAFTPDKPQVSPNTLSETAATDPNHPLMKTLKKLFNDSLAEIYDAEVRLVGAMPLMAVAATCPFLKEAALAHLRETEEHVTILDRVFKLIRERSKRKTSETTIALLNESSEIMSHFKGFPVINAALIAALQKIEHYEIASYGCLRDWAAVLGYDEAAELLQEILNDDKAANQSLTELARSLSNREALIEAAPGREDWHAEEELLIRTTA
jgi:ferritin-like metal-binding protein YciE